MGAHIESGEIYASRHVFIFGATTFIADSTGHLG